MLYDQREIDNLIPRSVRNVKAMPAIIGKCNNLYNRFLRTGWRAGDVRSFTNLTIHFIHHDQYLIFQPKKKGDDIVPFSLWPFGTTWWTLQVMGHADFFCFFFFGDWQSPTCVLVFDCISRLRVGSVDLQWQDFFFIFRKHTVGLRTPVVRVYPFLRAWVFNLIILISRFKRS